MARVEGRQHIFDVIKVNMFGVKQSRVMILEHADPVTGTPGKIQIATGAGKVKRDLDITAISGVEATGDKPGDDADRSVTFKFFENGAKEARRTIMFVSKRQRDAFLTELEKLHPRLVPRRKDGSLAGKDDEKKAKEDAKKEAERLAAAAASNTKGPASNRNLLAATTATNDDDDNVTNENGRFFAMEENDYGYQEPRMVTFSDNGELILLVDATAGGTSNSELRLRRLKTIALHTSDKSVLELMFHDGSVLKAVNKAVVLTFGSRGQRERFFRQLQAQLLTLEASLASSVEIDDKWRGPLPTKTYYRFEAMMSKPKKQPVALLVSLRKRKVFIIKVSRLPNYEPGALIPANAPLAEIMSITPHRLQLQRHPRFPNVLQTSDGGPQTPFSAREMNEFEFVSLAERERFCAYIASVAAPDDAPVLVKEGMSSAIVPTKAPAGTVRSTYRQPTVADTSWLWGAQWPHDDVKLWVGTYNVSGTPPPDNERILDQWLIAPARDPLGPRDLYIIGMQELGPTSNREAWGTTLAKHLASKADATANVGRDKANTYAAATAADSELNYVLVDHVYMWEMGMWVFVRTPHVPDITSISHADLPTGLAVAKAITGVQLGNKGGIGIGLKWRETSLAFVMCHLAARPDPVRLRKRESDYRTITRALKLDTALGNTGLDFVHAHDHVWFFGDVNYRIDLPYDRCVTLYKQKNFGAIMAHDQLIREQGKRRVFVGFTEGKIDFAPTYRWERNREEFSWKRGQAPSYTDRVLHRSLPGIQDKIVQTSYESPTFMYGSDHRAVSASYNVGIRRYYCAAIPPASFVPYPVPTFFSATDAYHLPVPVILLSALKIIGVQAMTAPAAIYLSFHAPWLEKSGVNSTGITIGTMTAAGITDAQKEALRALKTELAEQAKADAKKRKEEAKEAKAKAKAAKKEAKAKGEKEGPKVTIQGGPAPDNDKKDGKEDDDDSDDDGEDDEATHGDDYTVLEEDAEFAASAMAASALLDSANIDPKRKALLDLTVEYSWVPSETAVPPLRPICWDPRILRTSHIHVIAHASAGADGSFLAIGKGKNSGKATDSSSKVHDVVGQATIPLLPLIKNAQAAIETAWEVQAEEEDDETDAAVEALLRGGKGTHSTATKGKATKAKQVPVAPGALEAEVVAATSGIIDTTPDLFARSFNPNGVPWALAAPPSTFAVDIEFSGQPMGKLTGTSALRASTDKTVSNRVAATGGTVSATWNLDAVLVAMDKSARESKAVGDAGNKSTVNIDTPMPVIARESFSDLDNLIENVNENEEGENEAAEVQRLSTSERTGSVVSMNRPSLSEGAIPSRFRSKKMGSFTGGVSNSEDGGSVGSGSTGPTPRESFAMHTNTTMLPPPPSSLPMYPIGSLPPPPPMPDSYGATTIPLSPTSASVPGNTATEGIYRSPHALKPAKPSKTTTPATPAVPEATTESVNSATENLASPSSSSVPATSFASPNTPSGVSKAHALKPSKPPKVDGNGTPVTATIPETESSYTASMTSPSHTVSGTISTEMDSPSSNVSNISPRVHPLKPKNRPTVPTGPATKMTMTNTNATGGGGSGSMQVDARFAAFFEAQFAKKLDTPMTTTVDEDGTVRQVSKGPKVRVGGKELSVAKPVRSPATTSNNTEVPDATTDTSGADGGTVDGIPSSSTVSPTSPGTVVPPPGKSFIKPPPKKSFTIPSAVSSGSNATSATDATLTETGAEGDDETEDNVQRSTASALDDLLGDDDEDDEDDDDDEDEEEKQLAKELEASRLKREAVAAKIVSRTEKILGLISAAADKARAETNQKVVALWMPGTATSVISSNVRAGVGTYGSSTAKSHGYNSGNTFQGVSKLISSAKDKDTDKDKGSKDSGNSSKANETPAVVVVEAVPTETVAESESTATVQSTPTRILPPSKPKKTTAPTNAAETTVTSAMDNEAPAPTEETVGTISSTITEPLPTVPVVIRPPPKFKPGATNANTDGNASANSSAPSSPPASGTTTETVVDTATVATASTTPTVILPSGIKLPPKPKPGTSSSTSTTTATETVVPTGETIAPVVTNNDETLSVSSLPPAVTVSSTDSTDNKPVIKPPPKKPGKGISTTTTTTENTSVTNETTTAATDDANEVSSTVAVPESTPVTAETTTTTAPSTNGVGISPEVMAALKAKKKAAAATQ